MAFKLSEVGNISGGLIISAISVISTFWDIKSFLEEIKCEMRHLEIRPLLKWGLMRKNKASTQEDAMVDAERGWQGKVHQHYKIYKCKLSRNFTLEAFIRENKESRGCRLKVVVPGWVGAGSSKMTKMLSKMHFNRNFTNNRSENCAVP